MGIFSLPTASIDAFVYTVFSRFVRRVHTLNSRLRRRIKVSTMDCKQFNDGECNIKLHDSVGINSTPQTLNPNPSTLNPKL